MEHIEEHILELYVLNSDKVSGRRREIARHLKTCPACKSLALEMEGFYKEASLEVEALRESKLSEEHAILPAVVRHQSALRAPAEGRTYAYAAVSRRGVAHFIRRHPIITGFSTISFFAAILAGVVISINNRSADSNPAYIAYNVEKGFAEIRNTKDQTLWNIASVNLKDELKISAERRMDPAILVDLNGDGQNEVLTLLSKREVNQLNQVQAFGSDGKIIFSIGFNRQFQYLDRTYSQGFSASSVVSVLLPGNRYPDIFVVANHEHRSPSLIAHIDHEGNVIGEYWHFGQFFGMYVARTDSSGPQRLILVGLNDTQDTLDAPLSMHFPVAVVLDPAKIVGTGKSQLSPGYAMSSSEAELFYVKFPNSDIDSARGEVAKVRMLSSGISRRIDFILDSDVGSELAQAGFEYCMDSTMRVCEVRRGDQTVVMHNQLIKEGKVTRLLDDSYLEELKNGVRFWNGRIWTTEPARLGQGSYHP